MAQMVNAFLNNIERLIQEVPPSVEKLTEWDSHIDGLTAKIIYPSEFWDYELIIFASMGINTTPKTKKGVALFAEELECEHQWILAEYVTHTKTILMVPENLSKIPDMNDAVLALLLSHELMHHCQYTNNISFLERKNRFIKEWYDIAYSTDSTDVAIRTKKLKNMAWHSSL